MRFLAGEADVVVVGAGHAGIEAGLAAARLGCRVVVVTLNLDSVGNMPCNPCIGGTAKGQLVREIDALGGEMAKAADATFLQSRMLGRGKGPALHSPRVQSDRRAYQAYMKHCLERTERLHLRQGEVVEILTEEGAVTGVALQTGAVFSCRAVVLATGTYLKGRIFIGEVYRDSGPDGLFPSVALSACLEGLGIPLRRFKTGTPPRVLRSSLDLSQMTPQPGDSDPIPLSFETRALPPNKTLCHLIYTGERTHEIIRRNLHRSPLFGGAITGVGARYCPSIEDKVVKFADKEAHQVFVEPTGEHSEELYVQGMSSSLPEEVQLEVIRTLPGFERVQVMRVAYAIEYDCCDPRQLLPSLEFKHLRGLYGAGQFNGTSGYEEAAAQGLMAGINAARALQGKAPVVLPRSSSYLGTLIDDLVTKGTDEPYRMMTSRSEYRLLLRQDNADERLTPIGHDIGLISPARYGAYLEKQALIEAELRRLRRTTASPGGALDRLLEQIGSSPLQQGVPMTELLKRPHLTYDLLAPHDPGRPSLPREVREEVEIKIKYEGYIARQQRQLEAAARLEHRRLPEDLDYRTIRGLRIEAQQKLQAIRPLTVGQAGRIPGVSPADISVLLVALEQWRRDGHA
ncbi:MAG: tRNA uridine-5-carboxymethylaminomethyl(34) synthesis enzyme MnmG [Clostridiales bacterium]|nr:tRNA uridine-5-carboxymethylaminomethyl(34) synthesis enzyme MnmG [Clostridiales bacterium]